MADEATYAKKTARRREEQLAREAAEHTFAPVIFTNPKHHASKSKSKVKKAEPQKHVTK